VVLVSDWKVLFVEEELRDVVAELIGEEPAKFTCVENPFNGDEDWTEMLKGQPHKAVFKLDDGRRVEVKFWCRVNPDIGELYEYPVELNQHKIVVVVK
jgi:hypothetical protein